MKISRPIKTNRKTQAWGENIPCVMIGERPFKFVECGTEGSHKLYTGELNMAGHSGEDWASRYAEPIYFPVNALGTEWEASSHVDREGAVIVVVRSMTPVPFTSIPDHVPGSLGMIKKQYEQLDGKLYLQFWFVHLQGTHIVGKMPVKFGDLIGYADSTGASSGNHLHWSMKVSDQTSWFYIDGDNGYQGTIDFTPYFTNIYTLDILSTQSTDIRTLQLRVIDLSRQAISLLKQLILLKSLNK